MQDHLSLACKTIRKVTPILGRFRHRSPARDFGRPFVRYAHVLHWPINQIIWFNNTNFLICFHFYLSLQMTPTAYLAGLIDNVNLIDKTTINDFVIQSFAFVQIYFRLLKFCRLLKFICSAHLQLLITQCESTRLCNSQSIIFTIPKRFKYCFSIAPQCDSSAFHTIIIKSICLSFKNFPIYFRCFSSSLKNFKIQAWKALEIRTKSVCPAPEKLIPQCLR